MKTVREFQKARFSIDSLADLTFEGFTDGETWNGWACPYFSHESARAILQASQDNGYNWTYEAEMDVFLVNHRDDPEHSEPEQFKGILINLDNERIIVYGIGSYSWVWERLP